MKKLLYILILISSFAYGQTTSLKTLIATGVANTYAVSESIPSALGNQESWQIKFPANNSGASTLERATLGAKDIRKNDGSALAANDIVANTSYLISYSTTLGYFTCETCGSSVDLSTTLLKANNLSDLTNAATARTNLGLGTLATQSGTFTDKQDVLVSGTNIKTVGGASLLGPGDVPITVNGYTTTATSGGTTTLTASSTYYQNFSGASNQTVVLPVTSTLPAVATSSTTYEITNSSSGSLIINSSGGNLIVTVPSGTTAKINCILNTGTSAASWTWAWYPNNPLTAIGDLTVGGTIVNGVATPTRLSIGANTYILTSDGTTASWQAPSAAGVTSITGTANQITASGSTGAITLSLPSSIALSAAMTLTQNFIGNVITSTFTTTASNQSAFAFSGTITSRATVSDVARYLLINPTLVSSAATQTLTAVSIDPTFTDTNSATKHILRLKNAGTETAAFYSNGSLMFTEAVQTGLAANTESILYNFNATANLTWVDGTVSLERIFAIQGPTLNGTTTTATFNNPSTLWVSPPITGTKATLTNKWAINSLGDVQVQTRMLIAPSSTSAQWITTELALFRTDQNGATGIITHNNTSGTAAQSYNQVRNASSNMTMAVFSAGFSSTDLRVADAAVITASAVAGLNIGTNNATALKLYTNGTLRFTIDSSGIPQFSGTNTTGGGTALLGTNSPATTNSNPYTWIQIKTSDGSTAYIPAWK